MATPTKTYDFAVIGAGIAGASVAAELAQHASVLVIEMESHAGYHSTGRSAAMYIPSYGPAAIQALTRASGAFFQNPPEEFGTTPLLSPRAELMIARKDQMQALEAFYHECSTKDQLHQLTAEEVQRHCPFLKNGYANAGVIDASSSDMDVHAIHQGYVKLYKNRGGEEVMNSAVKSLTRKDSIWTIDTASGQYQASVVINAAGAWADEVGTLAGAETIGLVPKRRTALTIELPETTDFSHMPLVADINEAFYIKPDAGRLLISPANEDPMPPCDVQPDEMDIAVCIDHIENAFDIKVEKIASQWAGLRSFVSDKSPVVGYSKSAENFFWLAGQGGYGIQSSPALARYACAKVLNCPMPDDIKNHNLVADDISIDRLS